MSEEEDDYMSMVIEEPTQKETFTQRKRREQREVRPPPPLPLAFAFTLSPSSVTSLLGNPIFRGNYTIQAPPITNLLPSLFTGRSPRTSPLQSRTRRTRSSPPR
jgi:hypothetical protein